MPELHHYKKEQLTIDLVWANVFGILIIIPIVLIFGLPYYFIWKPKIGVDHIIPDFGFHGEVLEILLIFIILVVGIVVHELIHGITWARYTKNGFMSIKFGVIWKKLTPYCHCIEPLTVSQYIKGAIAPAIVLGVIPSLLALFIGHLGLLIFGIFFTVAAGGDFLIVNLIWKENKDDLVQDHPSEVGCYIYRKIEDVGLIKNEKES
jgi:hypothetical protein